MGGKGDLYVQFENGDSSAMVCGEGTLEEMGRDAKCVKTFDRSAEPLWARQGGPRMLATRLLVPAGQAFDMRGDVCGDLRG